MAVTKIHPESVLNTGIRWGNELDEGKGGWSHSCMRRNQQRSLPCIDRPRASIDAYFPQVAVPATRTV